MKKFITAFSIAAVMLGISCFAGCCFNTFSIEDFKAYISDENTSSKFETGFDIEVQDDTEIFLKGRILSASNLSLDIYGTDYYINGDGFVYVDDGAKKSKVETAVFDAHDYYGAVADLMDTVKGYLSDLKSSILDDASYYKGVSKNEADGSTKYTLDDNFYDGDFDYREILEVTYKDNKIESYVDAISGENTSSRDQTITITRTSEAITAPDLSEFTQYLTAEAFVEFLENPDNVSDMSHYTYSIETENGLASGEYHETEDGALLKLYGWENHNRVYELYVVKGKVYVERFTSTPSEKFCFDLNTTDSYFASSFAAYAKDAMQFSDNYALEILKDASYPGYEIDEIAKKEKNGKVEITIKKHRSTAASQTAMLKYHYDAGKMDSVKIYYSNTQTVISATALPVSTFQIPDLEDYKYVTDSNELHA